MTSPSALSETDRTTLQTYFAACKAIVLRHLKDSTHTKIIYTAVFGMINCPRFTFPIHEPHIDHVYFTDEPTTQIVNYKQIVLPTLSDAVLGPLTSQCRVRRSNGSTRGTLTNRAIKILLQELVPESYTHSIYHDVHSSLCMLPTNYWRHVDNDCVIAAHPHPERSRTVDEIHVLLRMNLTSDSLATHAVTRFKESGFLSPDVQELYPLTQNNVLIRRHVPKLRSLSWAWFTEFIKGILRDQVYLQFVAWSEHVPIKILPTKEVCRRTMLEKANRGQSKPKPKPKPKPRPNKLVAGRVRRCGRAI